MPRLSKQEATRAISERILGRRKVLDLSQQKLADKVGVTRHAIQNYENGASAPSADMLYLLADALKCTVDYLMKRTDDPEYMIVSGQYLPRLLRQKQVDAVEVLRSQVTQDGGLTEAAQREVLQIVSRAKLIHRRPQPTPDQSETSPDNPPATE